MKSALIIFLLILSMGFSKAQVFTGGNMSVNYYDGNYVFDFAPIVGYRIEQFRTGVSPIFTYIKYKDSGSQYAYGGRFINEFTVFEGFFLHGELEASNVEIAKDERKWIYALPVGAGYQQEIAKNTHLQGMVLYDVLLDKDSPRENPTVRAGIIYDF